VFSEKERIENLALADSHLHSALGGSLADDDIELEMLSNLGQLQGLKQIAIPETDTNWAIMLVEATNLSDIIVYEPRRVQLYDRLEEVEEVYAAGIRFKIELVDVTDGDSSPGCCGAPIFQSSYFSESALCN
jgi:hypothetical protein